MVIRCVPGHQNLDQGRREPMATIKATKPPTYHLTQFGATLEQRASAASPQLSRPTLAASAPSTALEDQLCPPQYSLGP